MKTRRTTVEDGLRKEWVEKGRDTEEIVGQKRKDIEWEELEDREVSRVEEESQLESIELSLQQDVSRVWVEGRRDRAGEEKERVASYLRTSQTYSYLRD